MLRKLNFTERARIPRAAVHIALRRESDGVLAFDASFDLTSVVAPAEARLFLEARYRTSYMRFDCGPFAAPNLPDDRRLTGIDSDGVVRFRLKLVDNRDGAHRIAAATDDITVSAIAGDGATRISILPVNFEDLGDVPWRVQFEPNGPVLELNNRVEEIARLARHDDAFFALVYPAAVREILAHILVIEDYEPAEDTEEWWSLWIQWARGMTDAPLPGHETEERRGWIDEVVAGFCGRHRAAEKLGKGEEPA